MENKKLSSAKALSLFIISIAIIFIGVLWVKAPVTIVLVAAAAVTITFAAIWGVKWDDIMKDLTENLSTMFPAILLLLSVGMLVGSWILSGTVPILIYYGLKILSPSIFLVAACLICAIMSVIAGTSWGTMGTVGVALMGVSAGLGIPAPYAAGAVLTGAIFGDKLSPLSDTTVFASAVSDVYILDHIKHMLFTTIPGFIISLILYGVLGAKYSAGSIASDQMNQIFSALQNSFNLNPVLLLPPVIILFLIYKKKPILPVFAVGIVLGGLLAIIFQGATILDVANTLNSGFSKATGAEIVDKMLKRGGLTSMLGTTAIVIGSAVYGSPLKTAGVIDVILDKIQEVAKSVRTIMFSGYLLHLVLFTITGAYYITFTIVGSMLKPVFDKYNIKRTNLSRLLEDTGTAYAPLVPWSVFAVFTAGTLGVPTLEYALYAPITYMGIILAVIYISTGFSITMTKPAKPEASKDVTM
ncbi:MAG TPA: Na+/H+ antiporter NhaC [Clostridia bacterium]|nr:Na+/H+ antiporter NhaC [Clostridia bacterium]